MSDLKELIEATSDVSLIQEAKDFLRKLNRINCQSHQSIIECIIENIDASIIYDAGDSDEPVKNVFSELHKAWSFGVNEYLKERRDEFEI